MDLSKEELRRLYFIIQFYQKCIMYYRPAYEEKEMDDKILEVLKTSL